MLELGSLSNVLPSTFIITFFMFFSLVNVKITPSISFSSLVTLILKNSLEKSTFTVSSSTFKEFIFVLFGIIVLKPFGILSLFVLLSVISSSFSFSFFYISVSFITTFTSPT